MGFVFSFLFFLACVYFPFISTFNVFLFPFLILSLHLNHPQSAFHVLSPVTCHGLMDVSSNLRLFAS